MTEQTERLGISKLDYYFSQEGWLFREQMIHDYGIDAQVEIVRDSYPTGSLIGIQIKTGTSYFADETDESYVFRTDDKHREYWAKHNLPVILVLYHPDLEKLFWQVVNASTLFSTGKHWKMLVPKNNVLDDSSFGELSELTQPEPYQQKLDRLRFDKPWMLKISEGHDVYVQFEDWVNKSLPRYSISIVCDDISHCWPVVYGSSISIEDILT